MRRLRRRLVGAERAGDDARRDAQRRRDPAGRQIAVQVERHRRARGVGWIWCPAADRGLTDRWRRDANAKSAPATWRRNRQASYRFNLLERFECGLVLTGTEVKSLREGKAQLKDSYATIRDGEVWLIGALHPALRPRLAREPRARARPQAAAASRARSSG